MRLDLDLIRDILLAIEAIADGENVISIRNRAVDHSNATDDYGRFVSAMQEDHRKATIAVILYHVRLLIDRGLVYGDAAVTGCPVDQAEALGCVPKNVSIYGLTWEGHDFLDTVRSEEKWGKIKEKLVHCAATTVVAAIQQVTASKITKAVNMLLPFLS